MKALLTGILSMALASAASAQTQDELKRDGNGGSTDNVVTFGMGYHQQRFSPLKQINKSTVKRLVPIWSASLNNDLGEQAQPDMRQDITCQQRGSEKRKEIHHGIRSER